MSPTTKTARIFWSASFAILICVLGVIGIRTPLGDLLVPGLYPIGDAIHGLGITAFVISLPLDFLLYTLIIYAILSLWTWLLNRKTVVD
jgi:hypothetical protein